jgi:hypothetical protein
MDQHRSSVPDTPDSRRSGENADNTPHTGNTKSGLPAGQVDIIAMVRSLQRTAGLTDCFRRGHADCDITDCDWRAYCLGTPADRNKTKTPPPK